MSLVSFDLGYYRRDRVGPPSVTYANRFGETNVVVTTEPLASLAPFATIGRLLLYLVEGNAPKNAGTLSVEPLLPPRVYLLPSGEPATMLAGIDGRGLVPREREPLAPLVTPGLDLRNDAHTPEYTLTKVGLLRAGNLFAKRDVRARDRVPTATVVLIDGTWEGSQSVSDEPPDWPDIAGVPSETSLYTVATHGTIVGAALRRVFDQVQGLGVRLRLVSALPPGRAGMEASRWLGPLGIAWAIARAVTTHRADVIVLPMSNTLWGMPRYLAHVLREAHRSSPGAPGSVIVCSTGDSASGVSVIHNGFAVALGAEDLACQPWVLGVGPTDEDGHWYRRYLGAEVAEQYPLGRFGPGVALAAPGFFTHFLTPQGTDCGLLDDTSQACALVGAAAALLRAVHPWAPEQVRAFLTLSAEQPATVDPAYGIGSGHHDGTDRVGHNLKLGYGELNATAALIAAYDPVAFGFVLASPRGVTGPAWRGYQRSPHLLLAQSFLRWCRDNAANPPDVQGPERDSAGVTTGTALIADAHQELLRQYVALRCDLLRIVLVDALARDALLWLTRHLAAILGSRPMGHLWQLERDHGALVARLAHLFEAVSDAAPNVPGVNAGDVQSWCARTRLALPTTPDDSVALARALYLRVFDFTVLAFDD